LCLQKFWKTKRKVNYKIIGKVIQIKGVCSAGYRTGDGRNSKDIWVARNYKEEHFLRLKSNVLVFPCEKEMEALAMGALRVLKGEKPKECKGVG